MLSPVDIEAQFERVTDYWSPKVIGRVNDQYIKVAKLKGEFAWHAHEGEDEMFLILRGHLVIQLEEGDVHMGPGQFVVVPRTVRHRPVADEECWIVLIETVTTKHTGDIVTPLTRSITEQLT
jgi:mannose-6-phosphate isomerase-like protein (cupin superfamily)